MCLSKVCINQVQQKRRELQEGEMHNYYSSETRSLQIDARTAALKEWKLLSDADRAVYQAEAAGTLQICGLVKNSKLYQSCLMSRNSYMYHPDVVTSQTSIACVQAKVQSAILHNFDHVEGHIC